MKDNVTKEHIAGGKAPLRDVPKPYHIYDSGGWGGVGYGGTSVLRYLSGGGFPYVPFAYGTPEQTGELNLELLVKITPKATVPNTSPPKPQIILNPDFEVAMKKTPQPSAQQKQVGVTAISGIEWVAVTPPTGAALWGMRPP